VLPKNTKGARLSARPVLPGPTDGQARLIELPAVVTAAATAARQGTTPAV
jgi:hypothetical protein